MRPPTSTPAPPASPTGRQLGPGKRDELPPATDFWSVGAVARRIADGFTNGNEQYDQANGDQQRRYIEAARAVLELPPIVSEGVERDAYIRELEGALMDIEGYVAIAWKAPLKEVREYIAKRARSALSKATGEGG